eukprot:m.175612 g.175612  ORF g.175612 m.175612 type:complete len:54 (-) comp15432_c1_seq3:1143-1304(-)
MFIRNPAYSPLNPDSLMMVLVVSNKPVFQFQCFAEQQPTLVYQPGILSPTSVT